jgi:hypothetical protein
MSQTQTSLTRAICISSLADSIGELRVPDLEKKVNLLSFHDPTYVATSRGVVVDTPTMNGDDVERID